MWKLKSPCYWIYSATANNHLAPRLSKAKVFACCCLINNLEGIVTDLREEFFQLLVLVQDGECVYTMVM